MTTRFTFDLAAVRRLAEHADQAAVWLHPASSDADGPGLLLCGDSNGVHLTSPAPWTSRPCSPANAHPKPPWTSSRCATTTRPSAKS
jgi:hypothetical protein